MTMDTPLTRFINILEATKSQLVQDIDEMIMTTDIISKRPNYLTVDERGYYHIQASGDIDDVMTSLTRLLEKLNRIKTYRENT